MKRRLAMFGPSRTVCIDSQHVYRDIPFFVAMVVVFTDIVDFIELYMISRRKRVPNRVRVSAANLEAMIP